MQDCSHSPSDPLRIISSCEFELEPQVQRITRGGRADVLCGVLKVVPNQKVAVKAFRRVEQNLNHLVIENEIRVWRLLCPHPHIASFIGIAPVNCYDAQYLPRGPVSYHCARGDLKTYLYQIDPDVINHQLRFRLLLGIVRGLKHIHAQSIVHGDLKALNILVDGTGELARICDFGSSSIECDCYSGPDKQEGTPEWDSPELWMSEEIPPRTQHSDIWAFGCVALEVQMGMTPWDPFHLGDRHKMQKKQVKAGEGPPASREDLELELHPIKKYVWEFIAQCWRAEPTQRPAASELSRFCETLAVRLSLALTTNTETV